MKRLICATVSFIVAFSLSLGAAPWAFANSSYGYGGFGLSEALNENEALPAAEEKPAAIDEPSELAELPSNETEGTGEEASELIAQEGPEEGLFIRNFDNTPAPETLRSLIDPLTGREYEEGTVLVFFQGHPGMRTIETLLSTANSVNNQPLRLEDKEDGTTFIIAAVVPGSTVSAAVAELNGRSGVEFAQPNYIYRVLENAPVQVAAAQEIPVPEAAQGATAAEEAQGATAAEVAQGAPAPEAAQGLPVSKAEIQEIPVPETFPGKSASDEAATPEGTSVALMTNDPDIIIQGYLNRIGINKAWSLAHTDEQVTVAVLDTGITPAHSDLAANLKGTYNVRTGGAVTSDIDPNGHGTHVSGIVAARTGNGRGVASAGWNPGLFNIALFYRNANNEVVSNSAYISAGINYLLSKPLGYTQTVAKTHNIRVINMSLGGYGFVTDDSAMTAAINNATNAGILVVCAAGNQDSRLPQTASLPYPCIPSDYPNCLSVIALSSTDVRASWSNYGCDKNISAPGLDIYSTTHDGWYDYKSGTSMASPVVASVAALLFSVKPSATPLEIKSLIQNTATDLMTPGFDDFTGYGKIDAYAALKALRDIKLSVSGNLCVISSNLNQVKDVSKWNFSVVPGTGNASVDSAGRITSLAKGTVTIKATLKTDPSIMASVAYTTTSPVYLQYQAHSQTVGWMLPVKDGEMAGTMGRFLRLEALQLSLMNSSGYAGSIIYEAHVANIGWQGQKVINSSGADATYVTGPTAGTFGKAYAIESMKISLTGDLARNFDIYYRMHCSSVGWLNWASNGQPSGTLGLGFQGEAIQIRLVEKGTIVQDPNGGPTYCDGSVNGQKGDVSYNAMTHVENLGNIYVNNSFGQRVLGTQGHSLRMEALSLQLNGVAGSVSYQAHVQNKGWMNPVSNSALAGTTGQSLRVEAFCMTLGGGLEKNYDIYYRSHVQNVGWTGWAKNGTPTGSAGYSYRMEALQVVIVKKNTYAPGYVGLSFYQR
ncbi:MAG: S8 family serine peptidase [Coriobacteriaceae bacterium]|jgi:subtilisin family serine protease/uncharacterized protein YjdB|nr:S8 family serine peptidase [Coriobacteriaceae bacterium]